MKSTSGRPPASAVEHPRTAAVLIAITVFLLVTLFWRAGLLQVPEFHVYDRFTRWRAGPASGETRVAVIGITEDDIERLEAYPVSDGKLAELLGRLLALEPAAIAIDLFRDKRLWGPEPDGKEALARVFGENPNVLGVQRLRLNGLHPILPPLALRDKPEQVGSNDFTVDEEIDGGARRALLLMDDRGAVHYSVDLLAALLYLQTRGIELAQDPAEPSALTLGRAHLSPMQANDGAYVGADMRGYQLLLDFRRHEKGVDGTPEAAFPNYSLHQVLDGKVPPEQIKGKVVLIGVTADSMKDVLGTPLGERYPGVMLHAQVVDQLLRAALDGARATRAWPTAGEAAWILGWTVLGVTLGVALRAPLGLAASGVAALALLFGTAWLAFRGGLWLLTVAPATGFALSAALSVAYVSQREWRRRMLLMRLFGRHVAPEVAEAVWEHRADLYAGSGLRPQKLTATVVFTDLRGFTTTAEGLEPEVLLAWLNEYLAAMAALVAQHGGVLCKFTGDGLMALFGAPLARTTPEEIRLDAVNAVRCLLALSRRLAELNAGWRAAGQPVTAMRAGVHTGPLVAGSIGGEERLEYTAMGDTVNTASRLESTPDEEFAPDSVKALCRILVSEGTHALLDGEFDTRQAGTIALKGKKEKVTVYFVPDHTHEGSPCSL